MRFHLVLLPLTLLTAACVGPEPAQTPAPSLPPPTPEAGAKSAPVAPVAALPRKKKPGPIPTRPINVKADCSFRDESGYGGMMKLAIDQARVQSFQATVTIPQRGSCRFDLKNFRQTRELPTVRLMHLHDPCIVHVWEQGERITVAFQECQKMCSGSAWEGLWPILTDTRDGSCA